MLEGLPTALFRRTRERAVLAQAVERVAAGRRQVVLVEGEFGVGKSELLAALGPLTTARSGSFIHASFQDQDRPLAFGAIVAGIRAFVQQMLGESDARLAQWRGELLTALGGNAGVLLGVVPELEHVIGKHASARTATQAQARLRMALEAFVDATCQPGFPLVLAFDDAHAADAESLQLLGEFASDASRAHLLVACAYRHDPAAQLPITSFVAALDAPTKIVLGALDRADLVAMGTDVFGAQRANAEALADVIERKTGGQPHAIRQLLQAMIDQGGLVHDGGWRWDLARFEAAALADDVATTVAATLAQLPVETREALALAACISDRFTAEELALAGDAPSDALARALEPARRAGVLSGAYRFTHDRVRQAARALAALDEHAVRLRLARRLPRTPERLFDLADHFNAGAPAITDAGEQLARCVINIDAGRRAKANGAYSAARHYLRAAIASIDTWQVDHTLAMALYAECAEVELLTNEGAAADALLDRALDHAATDLERVAVLRQRVWQDTARGLGPSAIAHGRRALELLGNPIPADDLEAASRRRLAELELLLAGRDIASLIDLPDATEPRVRAAMEVLDALQPATYMFEQPLYTYTTLELALLSLHHGNSLQSVSGYGALFSVFWALRGGGDAASYRTSHELGRVAVGLAERYGSDAQKSRAMIRLGACVSGWVEPVHKTLAILDEGHRLGILCGELQGAGLNLQYKAINAHFLGTPLEPLREQLERDQRFARKSGLELVWAMLEAIRLPALELLGAGGHEQGRFLEAYGKWPAHDACYSIAAAEASFVLGDADAAHVHLERASDRLGDIAGLVLNVTYNVISSLALAARWDRLSEAERADAERRIAANQARLAEWATSCPENFEHLHVLVEAERARLAGDRVRAIDAFDEAIEGASRFGFANHEAIACELAGTFWLGHGRRSIAATYLGRAARAYRRWGAKRKLELLAREHGELVVDAQERELETDSILKASQAISGEMELDALIASVLRVVTAQTGAEGAAVVVKEETGVVAYRSAGRGTPLDAATDLPGTVLRYVLRTGKPILLDEAPADAMFGRDPDIQRRARRSLLCVAMVARGTVRGAIYVEHAARAAFHREHLRLLELLASQAAISVDNAVLYRSLWASNKELERALEQIEENTRLKKELEIGARIQTSILPVELGVPGLRIAATMLTASEVGGDYYDVQPVPGGAWIGIGDVSGHGLNAGLVMLMVQSAIATLGRQTPDVRPSEIVSAVNALVFENVRHRLRRDEHVTLSLLRYDESGRIVFAGAHEDILVVRANRPAEWIATPGTWLGLRPDVRGVTTDTELVLESGDMLVVYTDGVIEARNGAREEFGTARLAAVAEAHHGSRPEVVRDKIVDAVESWSRRRGDDITVLVAQRA